MQRYFFHLNSLRDYIIDPEGAELPDLEAAKSDARETIREMAASYIKEGKLFTLWSIRIHDDRDKPLAEVKVADALSEVIHPNILRGPDTDSHV